MTILGISVGTVRTGLCVIQDGELIDRHLHQYPTQWSDRKLRLIINDYRLCVHKHGVTAIVVKIPPLHSNTKALRLLVRRIERLASENGCDFDLTTTKEMRHRLNSHTAGEVIGRAKELYPELANHYGGKDFHYKKVYEAVISAHIYQERQHTRSMQQANTAE